MFYYHLLSEEEQARYEAIGQAKGEAIGQAKGEAIGQAKGETAGKIKNSASNILALRRNLNVTADKAMELLSLTDKEKQQVLEHLRQNE